MQSSHNSKKELIIPKLDPVKFVEKGNGIVKGYAVNTFHGIVKDYNQDRVSIIMNITKPNCKGKWPKCSYFGVFDGHGGDLCSNFLKDNMHKYITENQYFPSEPIEALKLGFKKAEFQFLKIADSKTPPEKSGSCALVVLIIDDVCYVANVGDSRAVLSSERGLKIYPLSYDHKPDSVSEKTRIEKANGKIYQSTIRTKNGASILCPYRILPGKLSVSRSFGDIEAKFQKYGGNEKVLIAKPEITYFQINNQIHDFIVLGSDGIFDKLSNEEVVECFWQRHANRRNEGYDFIGEASSKILEQAMNKISTDNITSLIIVFQDSGKLDLPRKKVNSHAVQQCERQKKQQKENMGRSALNSMKNDRQFSSKLVQKLTMRRKSTNHNTNFDPQKAKPNQNSKAQLKLRKDNTLKVLPSHVQHSFGSEGFHDRAHREPVMQKEGSLGFVQKMLKTKNIQKIR